MPTPYALRRYLLDSRPVAWFGVGPDDVGAGTGLEVPAGIGLDERAQIHAATSLDELRALPFVVG